MGTVHKFKRPPKNKGQFSGYKPPGEPRGSKKKPSRKWGLIHTLIVLIGSAVAAYVIFSGPPDPRAIAVDEAVAVGGGIGASE